MYMGEEHQLCTPKENEVFIGRDMNCGDHAELFIEIRRDGKTVRTVNTKDVSNIEFEPTNEPV